MKTQARTILFLLSLTIALGASLFSPPDTVGHASEPGTTLYLPMIRNKELPSLGFELTKNNIINVGDELVDYHLDFIRGNLGSASFPLQTPYQSYLSGGWAAADALVLPNIDGWRAIGAEPLLIFMPGGTCSTPSDDLLDDFGDFVVQAVERYDLNYFEVWNEPDAANGAPSLYGCLGYDKSDLLVHLLQRIRSQLAPGRQMGVSFALGSQGAMAMVDAAAPYLDWVGIHHYGIYIAGSVVESAWPGSLQIKYDLVKDATNLPVWVTELNLRSPSDECGTDHQEAQRDYIEDAMDLGAPMINILVYKAYPDWQCTGFKQTLLADMLLEQRTNMP